jgi:hypothetical protein
MADSHNSDSSDRGIQYAPEYHPIDHWPGTRICRQYYGGARIHLGYAWHYKWSEVVRAHTLCRLGHHEPVEWWNPGSDPYADTPAGWACRNCDHPFDPPSAAVTGS